jgi:polar amino acid transport system ATP-binding protein
LPNAGSGAAEPARPPLLEIKDIHKRFGGVDVLKGVSLSVAEGEVVSIIGSSGSGKTTLLRCVNLLEDFDAGEVILDGEAIGYRSEGGARRRLGGRQLARQRAMIGMVFQSFNLFPHLTAEGNIMLGLTKVKGLKREAAREIAAGWLKRVGLADRAGHYPGELSGGQQQRVAIGRALAMNPKLVLLDEVTSALDPELVQEVLVTIRDIAREGATLLIVTHEMRFAREVSHRVVFMDQGRVAASGPPAELFANPSLPRLASFLRNTHHG